MLKTKNIFEILAGAIIVLAIVAVGANGFVVEAQAVPANANLYGWAWSSNIGWIKFKSTGTEPAYGVNIVTDVSGPNANIKRLTGGAWSSTIGWIKFNPISSPDGYPEANNAKAAQFSGTNIVGFARACTVFQNSDCNGVLKDDIYRGGWDGWIKMGGGTMANNWEGVRLIGNQLTGFAWGHEVLGWVKFHDVWDDPNSDCTGVCVQASTDAILNVQILGTGRVTGNGINCRSNDQSNGCSLNLGINSGALLTAVATGLLDEDTANYFVEWRGDCDTYDPNNLPSDTRCIINRMNQNRTVIAVFADGAGGGEEEQNTLTVNITGAGGTVTSDDVPPWIISQTASKDYNESDDVTLLFTPPANGSYTVSGACSGTNLAPPNCSLDMGTDQIVNVIFTTGPQFCFDVSYGPGNSSMRVNYQTQNLEASHYSTYGYVGVKDYDGNPANNAGIVLPTFSLRTTPLSARTPAGYEAPSGEFTDLTPTELADLDDDVLFGRKVRIFFPTDGQPTPNKASPYAGNYQFLINAGENIPACSSSQSPRVNFSYTDLREQEN